MLNIIFFKVKFILILIFSMGLCQSNELTNQKTISKAIDRQLNTTSKRVIQKMLLLGIYYNKFFLNKLKKICL